LRGIPHRDDLRLVGDYHSFIILDIFLKFAVSISTKYSPLGSEGFNEITCVLA
jgi:hypothetical protein